MCANVQIETCLRDYKGASRYRSSDRKDSPCVTDRGDAATFVIVTASDKPYREEGIRIPDMQADAPIANATEPLRVLLVTTLRWPLAARLAVAFKALGCVVDVWCPRGHPVEAVHKIRNRYRCRALFRESALRSAIQSSKPDLIIPCDDDVTQLLIALHRATKHEQSDDGLLKLIEKSLGTPDASGAVTVRQRLLERAQACGLRTPACAILHSVSDLENWTSEFGFPTVLKLDHSCGGQGVLIVHDHQQARRAYQRATRPSWMMALRDLILRRNATPLLERLRGNRAAVSAHQFIDGAAANRAVACWEGRVLAGISVIAMETDGETGPATVVRLSSNAEMAAGAGALIASLGMSGLCGLDFIIEEGSGDAYLIEMNPRATPICHLALGVGFNLPAALVAQLHGAPQPDAATAPRHARIAMFPGEWRRDPDSQYLRTAHHDVPWDEEALVRECIALPWEARGLAARLRARLRKGNRVKPAAFPTSAPRHNAGEAARR